MRKASLATIFVVTLYPGLAASTLNGVWVLNPAKSRLGPEVAPQSLVLALEQVGSHLATWRVTGGPDGKHVTYREYTLDGKERSRLRLARSRSVSIAFPVEATEGTKTMESWHVSPRSLVIRRSVNNGRRTVRQKLVFEPPNPMPETGTEDRP